MGALLTITMQPGLDGGPVFMTDHWMDEAYEHIRNDGDFQTIIEPIEQLYYAQEQTGGKEKQEIAGLYGSLEEPRLVAGQQDALQELQQDVMQDPDILVDEEHIHDYLEDLGTTDYTLEEAA